MNAKEKEEKRKKAKNVVIQIIAIATVFLVAMVGSASAQNPGCVDNTNPSIVYRCGDTVTTSCTFNGSMTCPAGSAGLNVGMNGIAIDGNDYKITGGVTNANCEWISETDPGYKYHGIYNPGYDDVVIRNLEIEGFCTGIWLHGTGPNKVGNNTIDNCSIHDNGFNTMSGGSSMGTQGIHACHLDYGTADVPALTITHNDIYNNEGTGSGCGDGGNGIFIYAGSPDGKHEYCNISYNDLHHNAKGGFWTKMMLTKCNITHNHAWGNGHGTGITDDVRGGIILRCKKSNLNFIAYNNASNNVGTGVGYGIYVGGDNNTIVNNTANESTADGICMGRTDGSSYNQVRNNTVCRNDRYGIQVVNSPGNTLYDNYVCDNGNVDIHDADATTGDDNTCTTASGYCDASVCPGPPYCANTCPEECEIDLDVTYKDETWHNATHYNVTYKITNKGYLTSVATNTSITIDGTEVDRQSCPALTPNAVFTGTSGPHPVDNTVAVNGAAYIDEIEVCADMDYDDPRDCDRTNNNETNIFGGPDLLITDFHEVWIDSGMWKTYNLSYTVENVGDIALNCDVWTNFTELEGEWSNCIDPVPISAGLAVSASVTHIAGPFVMEGDHDWLQAWVNFNYTCPVNEWNELHHDRTRFCPGYADSGGCCDECGDVYIDTFVDSSDIGLLRQKVSYGATLDCNWAGDVYCDGLVDSSDIGLLRQKVSYGATLNCCKGCE